MRRRASLGDRLVLVLICVAIALGSSEGAARPLHGMVVVVLAALPVSLIGFVLALRRRWSFQARVARLLVDLGICSQLPVLKRQSRKGATHELAWRMPPGVSVSALMRRREEIEQALDVKAEFWFEAGLIHMRAASAPLPKRVEFASFYKQAAPSGELVVGLGMTRDGPLWVDLAALPHLLIGGQTSGGKSALIRQILARLVVRHPTEELRLALVDLKGGLEFNAFERLPHALRPAARNLDSCLELMEVLLAELDHRQVALDRSGAESIGRWNLARPDQRLPRVVVVIDEMAELIAVDAADRDDKARRQAALGAVSRLCRLGRATGFHVIVSTQRPDADAVPGQIKANIPATVAFRVRSAINSRILLGEDNTTAASLPPHAGRGIWQFDREAIFQSIWLSKESAEAILAQLHAPETAGTACVTPCIPGRSQEEE